MDLIQQIRETETAERQQAGETYIELLARHAEPLAGDPKKLRNVLAVLGKTGADLAEDLAIVTRSTELERAAQAATDPALVERITTAASVLQAFRTETAAILQNREAGEAERFNVFIALNTERSRGTKAAHELTAFRNKHHLLLGQPESAVEVRAEPSCTAGTWPPAPYLHPLRA